MDLLAWISIVFFLSIGAEYLGWAFQYQNFVIGLSALAIGLISLINVVRASK